MKEFATMGRAVELGPDEIQELAAYRQAVRQGTAPGTVPRTLRDRLPDGYRRALEHEARERPVRKPKACIAEKRLAEAERQAAASDLAAIRRRRAGRPTRVQVSAELAAAERLIAAGG